MRANPVIDEASVLTVRGSRWITGWKAIGMHHVSSRTRLRGASRCHSRLSRLCSSLGASNWTKVLPHVFLACERSLGALHVCTVKYNTTRATRVYRNARVRDVLPAEGGRTP